VFRRGWLWLPIACAPALAACSLLLGDGLSDADAPQPGSDSGADSPINGGDDGATNPPRDGAPTSDGSLPFFDGGKLSCADAAGTLCDDFERDEPKGGPWGTVSVNDGGTLVIGKPSSTGRRLESAITAADGVAQLSRELALTPSKLHIELTLEILALPTNGAIYITGALMLNPGNPVTLFYVYARGDGAFVVEQLTDGTHYVQSPLAITLNAPHRLVIDVQIGGKVKVTVDGATQVDKNTESWLVFKPPQAILGAGSVSGGNAFSMRVDDYVFVAE
jgi:hypothetical protein